MPDYRDCIRQRIEAERQAGRAGPWDQETRWGRFADPDEPDTQYTFDDIFGPEPQRGPGVSETIVQARAAEAFERAVKQQQYEEALSAIAIDKFERRLAANPDLPSNLVLHSILANVWSGRVTGDATNAFHDSHALAALYFLSPITDLMAKLDNAGNAEKLQTTREIIRALKGEPSTPLGRQFAEAIETMVENIRDQANAVGARIPKREHFLPRHHDHVKMLSFGRTENEARANWVQWMLDHNVMAPKSLAHAGPDAVRNWLGELFDDITKRRLGPDAEYTRLFPDEHLAADGRPREPGSYASRFGLPREISFATAADEIAYFEAFGSGSEDLFSILTGYATYMARQIGLMQHLGPDPLKTLAWLRRNSMKKHDEAIVARMADQPSTRASRAAQNALRDQELDTTVRFMLDGYLGPLSSSAQTALGTIGETARLTTSSAMLGSMLFAQVVDLGYLALQARISGMPVFRTTMTALGRVLRGFTDTGDREAVLRLGFDAEVLMGVMATSLRMHGMEHTGRLWSRNAMNAIVRWQGAKTWTEVMRASFMLDFSHHWNQMADSGVPFNRLPTKFRRVLDRYNITEGEWGAYVSTPKSVEHRGVAHRRLIDMARRGETPLDPDALASTKLLARQARTIGNSLKRRGGELSPEDIARIWNERGEIGESPRPAAATGADPLAALSPEAREAELAKRGRESRRIKSLVLQRHRLFDDLPADPELLEREFTRLGPRRYKARERELIRESPMNHVEVRRLMELEPQLAARQADLEGLSGSRAGDLERFYRETALKIGSLFHTEMYRAIPAPDPAVRYWSTFGTRAGTGAGEAMRSTWGYLKTFPLSQMMIQINAMLRDERLYGSKWERFGPTGHLAFYAVTFALLGAIAQSGRDLSKGLRPPPFDPTSDEWQNWFGGAMVRTGAAGMWGDLFFAALAKGPLGGAGEWAVGPIGTGALTAGYGVVSNLDEPEKIPGALWATGRKFVPGQSFWPVTLAANRLILDTVTKMVDDDPQALFRRQRQYLDETGQESLLLEPGEPDL